eukprot:4118656-Lingulodinium_polyedra.AAC.1
MGTGGAVLPNPGAAIARLTKPAAGGSVGEAGQHLTAVSATQQKAAAVVTAQVKGWKLRPQPSA